jgi:CRISPR-associated protein Cas2
VVVIVLTACPAGLRGHLTRWLLEIAPGVFVGAIPARVRDLAWARTVELSKDGKAIMVYATKGEQRLAFKVHRHDWVPVDFDGLQLMLRPSGEKAPSGMRKGWSSVGRMRAAKRRAAGSK